MGMDYSLYQKIIDGTGRILDTDMTTPNVGKYVTEQQLADWINGQAVVMGYLYNGVFYSDAGHTSPLTGKGTAIYIDKTGPNDAIYRWDGAAYVPLTEEAQVQAVITALQNGTLVPLKAIQDQNGNVIDTTYATKTELSAEATARTNADSNLQQQINQHDSRLKNIEQKAGDYVAVQYRGTNAVPTGKASYGLVEKIVGKSRGWNQMVDFDLAKFKTYNTDGTWNDNVYTFNDVTFTVDTTNKTITVNGTASAYTYFYINPTQLNNMIEGHKYLMYGCPSGGSWGTYCLYLAGGYFLDVGSPNLAECTAEWLAEVNKAQMIAIWNGATISNKVFHCGLRDVTLIFPEGVPATVAECVQKCPDILKYNAYDAGSLVSTTVEGVESVGVNIWDEDFQNGYFYNTANNGAKESSVNWNCSRNKQPCVGGTDYYLYVKNKATFLIHVIWFDADNNYITYVGKSTAGVISSPVNACFFAMNIAVEEYGGTTYNHDIQICLNSYADKTTYHPYQKNTLTLPSPITLRSAGSGVNEVHDTLDVESGVPTENVKRINFDTLDWHTIGAFWYAIISDAKKENNFPATCSNYPKVDASDLSNNLGAFATSQYSGDSYAIYVYIDLQNEPVGSMTYALDEPNTKPSIGAVINNFIEVEGGGTINTIQTQTPVIDNCLDVGYLAL